MASNFQIFMTGVYLHINSNISTFVNYMWLLLSSCSLSYYSSSACQDGLQLRVWAIPSSFYFGHKSFKASVRPKSFNYIISYPTTNPTHPPWLITKPSWFIHSTLCSCCTKCGEKLHSHQGDWYQCRVPLAFCCWSTRMQRKLSHGHCCYCHQCPGTLMLSWDYQEESRKPPTPRW